MRGPGFLLYVQTWMDARYDVIRYRLATCMTGLFYFRTYAFFFWLGRLYLLDDPAALSGYLRVMTASVDMRILAPLIVSVHRWMQALSKELKGRRKHNDDTMFAYVKIYPRYLQSTHYSLCIFMCLGLAPQIARQVLALCQGIEYRFLYIVGVIIESHML